jgi:hypothetical protein
LLSRRSALKKIDFADHSGGVTASLKPKLAPPNARPMLVDRYTLCEKRFTKVQITQMLALAGFDQIRFSDWPSLGARSRSKRLRLAV